jgi:hypothetical protein
MVSLATAAHADTPGAKRQRPLAESLQGSAKEAYVSASLLMKHGDFAGAELKYNQAYELSSDPRLLFDEAVCEKELRHYARMQAFLLRYRSEAGAGMSVEDQRTVEAALGAIKNLVGSVAVTSNVPGAELVIDDEPAGTTPLPAPLVLDLGKHKVGLRKEGYEPVETTIEVQGGVAIVQPVSLVAHVRTAHVVVAAEPDATIALDGTVVARERFDGTVAPGTHALQVLAPGKTAYQSEVELREGETRTMEVTLKARPTVWPWVLGAAVTAAGLGVGAYFLFRPQPESRPAPAVALGGGSLSSFVDRW